MIFDKTKAKRISDYIPNIEDIYYLNEQGQAYSSKSNRILRLSGERRYSFIKKDGKYCCICLKKLYKIIYNKEFCIDNIEDLQEEIWREIPQTNGRYYASNKGRIKSYTGFYAIILEPYKNNGKGSDYYRVGITFDKGSKKDLYVHNIVAALFIEKPKDSEIIKYYVHHKDFNKYNNCANNLEYLTALEHKHKHMKHNEEIKKKIERNENNIND